MVWRQPDRQDYEVLQNKSVVFVEVVTYGVSPPMCFVDRQCYQSVVFRIVSQFQAAEAFSKML